MPKLIMGIDIETYSSALLPKCGVYRYTDSPDFEILLFSYAFDDGPIITIDLACGEALPTEVLDALEDKSIIKAAWNAAFERVCLSKHIGHWLDPHQWRCTAVMGAYSTMPPRLGDAAVALNVTEKKMEEGKDLIRYFSVPCKATKANGGRTRNLPQHAPEKWALYKKYNAQDVATERALRVELEKNPLPEYEWELYALDQIINDRGVRVDKLLVKQAMAVDQELASGTDISTLKPDEITAYISAYAEQQGVDLSGLTPDGLTATVLAYEEVTGGALTTSLAPTDITAIVTKYLEAEGIDLSSLSPDQIEAIVTSFAEATNCDKSTLLQDFTATITAYDDTNAVKPKLTMSVGIYGYDLMAYRQFIADNHVEVQGIVKLGEVFENPSDAISDPNTKFYQNGQEIPVTAVPTELLTADKVAVLGEDGTLHVLVAPQITGTQEAIDAISPMVDEVDQLGTSIAGVWAGIAPTTTMDMVGSAVSRINSYTQSLDYNSWERFWATFRGENTDQGVLNQSMTNDFSPERVAELSAYVGEIVAAIQTGQQVSEADLQNLQSILTFLQGLDTTQTGTHILEGIGEGMTAAGWDSDAETVASNLETALNLALGIHSPSTRVKPVGGNVSAGVGVGMTEYDFSGAASSSAARIESVMRASLTVNTLRPVGVNAMRGLTAGINAGRSGVIAAMRSAARAAVNAAKAELEIHSPSDVFKEEVGVMSMRGFGEGIIEETKAQAKIIRNASRYLTGEAREGAIATTGNDNRRTYNNNVTSTIQVQQMVVRDEQDIRSLAVEIATLTRRQQRGKGLRMA